MEVFFTGTIERIIFENASNFFKILLLEIEDTDSDFDDVEVIITGTMADVIEGEEYTFWGTLTQHPKYGEQLQSVRYERAKPTSGGLVKYFSSEQFKGIGKKTAQRIVELYGDNTIDKILESPEQLRTISGLSKINREAFIAKLKLNYGTEQVLAKLAEYGLSNRAAIIHTLVESSMEQGDTYIEARTLLEKTITLLEEARQIELDPSIVAKELTNLIAEDKVQHIGTKIFSNTLFFAEEGIKKNLQRILNQPLDKQLSHKDIDHEIRDIQKSLNIHYDNIQEKAIREALLSKVFILTGGPGTGKTTVINGIIEAYSELHHIDLNKNDIPIVLAAPTGRAARRMNELTGLPSATIHRHLGLNGDSDYQSLDDYLDCSLIIIDEFSMVDTWLANQLFDALDSHTQVIIVGDSDQLPSVGPGQVLADLLNINALPHIKLEKIFRQSEESTIVTLANQMRQGFLPEDFTAKKADRSYFEASANIIPNMISKIVQSALKSGIEAHEIQILAPMYRGQAGINNLNLIMQNLLNPLKDNNQFTFNDINFRIGDKVLHLVNDTELNVFNGDIGYITDLIPAKYTESKQDEIYMTFDGQEVIYQRKEWLKITLAYAMSIHKSQGSEFQVVILPITRQSGRMLQRNLIYTAITRSKSKLILLGEIGAFDFAVKNEGAKRNTYLIERFENKQEIANSQKIEDSSIDQKIDNTIINTSIPKTATPIEQTNLSKITYRLTEENYLTIDPMIGINQQDISAIFDSK
ncbi:TPA: ATP-dependent RecD-like DNA helicase [Streptococcus agalactiae]